MPTLGEMLLWRYAILISLIVVGVGIGFAIRKLRRAIDRARVERRSRRALTLAKHAGMRPSDLLAIRSR